MKRCVATLLLMLTFCAVWTTTAIAAARQQNAVMWERVSRSEWRVTCILPPLRVDSVALAGEQWCDVRSVGIPNLSTPGEPALPFFSIWIPATIELENLALEPTASREIPCAPPLPAPQPLDRSLDSDLIYLPSESAYLRSAPMPGEPMQVAQHGKIGLANITLLTLHPVRYWSAHASLLIQDTLIVRVQLPQGASLDDNTQFSRFEQTVISQLAPISLPDPPPLELAEPRMWIVTEPEFDETLSEWRNFKSMCGIPSEIIHYSSVATSPASLRDYLQGRREQATTPPEFLFIVGDFNIVPAFFGVSASLTDHPYSCLSGSDYLPDLSVGRLPVQSNNELSDWIERALNYERESLVPGTNATVFSSAVALDPQHGEEVHTLFDNAGLSATALQQPQSGALPLLVNSLNADPLWTFYIGHGTVDRWSSVAPHLTTANMSGIQNARAGVVVAVACATADFDEAEPSFGESWNIHQMQGALCYIGATESTAFFYSDTIGLAALTAAFNQEFDFVGQALDYGKLRCAESFPQPPGGLTEETMQQFVLLGDPSLRSFTAAPRTATVEIPSTVPVGTTHVPVTVTQSGSPVANSVVTLSRNSAAVSQVRTNSDGFALVPLPDSAPLQWTVTITGRNLTYSEHAVDVVPANGALLRVAALEFEDSNGDHDGLTDRGESGTIRVLLRNQGTAAFPSGALRIESGSQEFALLSMQFAVPMILPQSEEWAELSPGFAVSDSAADGTIVPLQFWSGEEEAEVFVGTQSVRLNAPSIDLLSQSMSELEGDGDGFPEAGEHLALDLVIVNRGSEPLRAPQADCSPDHEYLHIDSTRWIGNDLGPEIQTTIRYTFRSDSSTPRGYPFEFNVALSGVNQLPLSFWGSHHIDRIPALLYVLDSNPQQVDGLEAALTVLNVEFERTSILPTDLSIYASIWIFCGVHPNQEPLGAEQAQRIAEYLDDGGACYWEGGDVWAFDYPNNLHPYFGIDGLADGVGDAGPIQGVRGRFTEGMDFAYGGENSFIDRITATGSAENILANARANSPYAVCVANSGATYRTIGSSVEIGSFIDGEVPSRRVELIAAFLDWFGIPVQHDVTPPVITHVPTGNWHHASRPIPLMCDVQDESQLDIVACDFRVNEGAQQSVSLVQDGTGFSCLLPTQPYGTTIRYRLRATDRSTPQNTSVTDEYTIIVEWYADRVVELLPPTESLTKLRKRGASGTLSLTRNGTENPGVVLLAAKTAEASAFVTEVLDLSSHAAPQLSFCSDLAGRNPKEPVLARVWASTDGGATFPHLLWRAGSTNDNLSGKIGLQTPELAGQENVVIKFAYYADQYWEITNPQITDGEQSSQIVQNLVVRPGESIRLHWKPASQTNVSYRVLAACDLLDEFKPIAVVQDTFFEDRDWSNYAQRFYRVEMLPQSSPQRTCEMHTTRSFDRLKYSMLRRTP